MIHRTAPTWQTPGWQQQMAEAFDTPADLLHYLQLDASQLPAADQAARQFRLKVPRGYAELMEKGNPDDPLLRQVWPSAEELEPAPGFGSDPVGDQAAGMGPGILQKYPGRMLLIVTGACAINCRYCFRRHYPYQDSNIGHQAWWKVIERIQCNPDIDEVILSGGDPLSLSDHRLEELVQGLDSIPHLKVLRIHTRLPVVLPERITSQFTKLLTSSRLQPVLVLHLNHPREMVQPLRQRLQRLRTQGVTLLNQSVLLCGVNDSPALLARLSKALFDAGVLPYYLHLLDRVQGAAHFQVSEQTACRIQQQLRALLPGYLVPRLVQEIPGEMSKTPVV